jgi:hypothetical protein
METKKLWVVISNTDLTEGRGAQIPIAVCYNEVTAKRHAKGKYVQGMDCPIIEMNLICIENRWYVPIDAVRIIGPSKEDIEEQKRIDTKRNAIQKARDLGLTDDDLRDLGI